MELIEKIRAKINEFTKHYLDRQEYDLGWNDALEKLLAFLDTLQVPIKVYRVENEKEQKGLWRKFDGTWEPLFDMLTDGQCRNMPMDDSEIYRAEGTRWFASAPSTETLQKWFSKRDLEELTAAGFTITEFTISKYKILSEFEYIFPRESILETRQLSVKDIYPNTVEDAMKELDEKIALVKQKGTWIGVDVDKYMDEVRGREPKFDLDKLREVAVPLSEEEKEAHRKMMDERRKKYEEMGILQEPEVDLEKAAVNAYESWKGGTMDDFIRDMETLGKIVEPLRNAK